MARRQKLLNPWQMGSRHSMEKLDREEWLGTRIYSSKTPSCPLPPLKPHFLIVYSAMDKSTDEYSFLMTELHCESHNSEYIRFEYVF